MEFRFNKNLVIKIAVVALALLCICMVAINVYLVDLTNNIRVKADPIEIRLTKDTEETYNIPIKQGRTINANDSGVLTLELAKSTDGNLEYEMDFRNAFSKRGITYTLVDEMKEINQLYSRLQGVMPQSDTVENIFIKWETDEEFVPTEMKVDVTVNGKQTDETEKSLELLPMSLGYDVVGFDNDMGNSVSSIKIYTKDLNFVKVKGCANEYEYMDLYFYSKGKTNTEYSFYTSSFVAIRDVELVVDSVATMDINEFADITKNHFSPVKNGEIIGKENDLVYKKMGGIIAPNQVAVVRLKYRTAKEEFQKNVKLNVKFASTNQSPKVFA